MDIKEIEKRLVKEYHSFIDHFMEPDPYIDSEDMTPPYFDLEKQAKIAKKILETGPSYARKYKLEVAGRFIEKGESCQSSDGDSIIYSEVKDPGEIVVTRDWGKGLYSALRKLFSKHPDDTI